MGACVEGVVHNIEALDVWHLVGNTGVGNSKGEGGEKYKGVVSVLCGCFTSDFVVLGVFFMFANSC